MSDDPAEAKTRPEGEETPVSPESIPDDDDALLRECVVQTFRSGGKGGQHQNTTDSGVRLIHRPTGVVATARERRSQGRNKKLAIERLRTRLQELSAVRAPRIPTRTPKREKQKRKEEKRRRSQTKKLRKPPSDDA